MRKPLLDRLYRLNSNLSKNPRIFETIRFNSVIRLCIRVIANNLVPIFYQKTPIVSPKKLPVVVSLTSFPARINRVWIVIETMLRQQYSPERVILWLSKDQFTRGLTDLPSKLVSQQSRGLEIRFVDGDIRSHKKYYYAFSEFNDKYVLTIDDDLLFPSTFIKDVYECAKRHPNSVIANFGSKFLWNAKIEYISNTTERIKPEETGLDLFFGSGGGTLFQPKRLLPYMDNIETIWNLCPTADDIYLNAITRLAGLDVTFMDVFPLLSLTNNNDTKLTDLNGNLYNSTSTNADQLRALVGYQNIKWGQNPFEININE